MYQETFDQLLTRISKDEDLASAVEEVTRQGAVLPVLAHLGWNTYNIREVIPEYRIEQRKVDYCLKINDKNKVFIEVKRTVEDLERHEEQLLDYSFREGARIAVLTNGLIWWFYLPLSGGRWQDRKFFTIDIGKQAAETAAGHFQSFLSKTEVQSGNAVNSAEALQASREKDRLTREALPGVWKQMLETPPDRLIDLICDQVESLTGHRPKADLVVAFIHQQRAGAVQPPARLPGEAVSRPPARPSPQVSAPASRADHLDDKFMQRGIAVQIDGQEYTFYTVREFYQFLLRFLVDSGHMARLEAALPVESSSVRYLLARSPVHPRGNRFKLPVEYQGYYLEASKDYKNAFAGAKKLLDFCGVPITKVRDID